MMMTPAKKKRRKRPPRQRWVMSTWFKLYHYSHTEVLGQGSQHAQVQGVVGQGTVCLHLPFSFPHPLDAIKAS
jgi:hypothetical protein